MRAENDKPWAVITGARILQQIIFICIDRQGGTVLRHCVVQMGEGRKDEILEQQKKADEGK